MRILIADDHAVFRRGLRETLREAFAKAAFGEANTAEETLEFVRRSAWDVLILDISMPGKSGLDILEEVKRLRPRLPVLFLSMHPEEQYARRALKAGAAELSVSAVQERMSRSWRELFPRQVHGIRENPRYSRGGGQEYSEAHSVKPLKPLRWKYLSASQLSPKHG